MKTRLLCILALLLWVTPACAEPLTIISTAQGLPTQFARALVGLPDGDVLERNAPHLLLRFAPPYTGAPDKWPMGRPAGMLSPGMLDLVGDGSGAAWLSTNDGVWHVRP